MRKLLGLALLALALNARADFTMSLDSVNAPMSGNVSLTVNISLLSGSLQAAVPIPGTGVVPFQFSLGQSPLTLTFVGLPTSYTAIGMRTTIVPVGMTATTTVSPLILDTPFPAPQFVPAGRTFTVVYTAPLLSA